MPTGEPGSPALDADRTAEALRDAEVAVAEAEARAAAARARAERARRQARAEAAEAEDPPDTPAITAGADGRTADDETELSATAESAEAAESVATSGSAAAAEAGTVPKRRPRMPSRTTLCVAALIVVLGCSLAATALMVRQHLISAQDDRQTAEAAAAARENTQVLMTMDHANAEDGVQRVLDRSTGTFKDHYQEGAKDLVKDLERSKVVTKVTVNDIAVESTTDNSVVVLVAARTEGTNAEGAPQQPQLWRIAMTLTRDSGQLKISDVEFVQ